VVCREFGPPEKLAIETIEDPVPGEGEVVVDVSAAAITFPDTLIIEDRYQFKATPPFVLGNEAAGVVSAVGAGVSEFAVGDEVIGGRGTGAFAERVAIPVASLAPLPAGLDFAEATGFGYAYGTGYYGLRYCGDLKAGETLLVLGAAGAVGLAAVELGRLLGARVIAAAGAPEKLELCRRRGADEVIDYTREGVNVVYDAIGGDYAESALRAIAWRGRFLVIGFTAGIPRMPLNLALLKGCSIVGVFWGAASYREPELFQKMTRELAAHAAAGDLRPLVSRRYALEEVPQALRDMLERRMLGKSVVAP
jgi:NADPH2:quinone reductase